MDLYIKPPARLGIFDGAALLVDERAHEAERLDRLVPVALREVAHADVVVGLVGPDRVGEVVGDPPQEREGLGVLPGLEEGDALQVEAFEEEFAGLGVHLHARLLEALQVAEVADRLHLLAAGEGMLTEPEIRLEADRIIWVLLDDRLEDLLAPVVLARVEQFLPLPQELEGGVVARVALLLRLRAAPLPHGPLRLGDARRGQQECDHPDGKNGRAEAVEREESCREAWHRFVSCVSGFVNLPVSHPYRRRRRSGGPSPRAADAPRSTGRSWGIS